ncbi:MAG TPA: PAS domain-containing protein [Myxococcales bacterium]|nr:PAS domain-containing protein [Myxococcales bacterium]
MRDEASSAERFSPTQAETEDPVRLAIDAAEIGAWNWHIASGHVEWTPWTYQLFGQRPGVAVSKEWFLDCVHPEDRRGVADWLSQALRQGGRTAFEFRIDRPDGSVRWMRSTGRALSDENGHVVRMVGVVEDVTDQQERHANVAQAGIAVSPPLGGASFSARQVAHILGVAQVTVKRLTAAGEIRSLRSTRKNSQRFAPQDVIEYLRNGSKGVVHFDAAVAEHDVSGCVIALLDQVLAGTPLETLLDECVRPAARVAPARFVADLLSRLPFIVPEPPRNAFPALLVEVGIPEDLASEIIACLLRSCGHEVLRPAVAPDANELGELAERVRARFVVVAIGEGPEIAQQRGLAAAAAIARARSSDTLVCVHGDDNLRVPRGVLRVRTMRELAAILRRS